MNDITTVDEFGTRFLDAATALELGARVVGWLRAAGYPARSRIGLRAANSPAVLSAVLGTLRGGYAPVLLGEKLTVRELAEMTQDIDPAVVLDARALAEAASAEPAELGVRFGCRPIHFTSGTSGRPKAVWSGWLSPPEADALVGEENDVWGLGPDDVHVVCGPVSHSGPLRFALFTLQAGGSVLIAPTFDPQATSRLIEAGTATTSFMAPAHLQRILDGHTPSRHAMRLLAHAGSSCPERVRRLAYEVFGLDAVREFYGSTECQYTMCTPAQWLARPGTVGRARPGRELRIAEDGRIWCRAPRWARFEYWGDEEKTAAAWDGDWVTVGDLGRLDDAGYLFIDGRRSDLIITGGVNVYPAEIERIVGEIPGVKHAVAFGVDDEQWGQKVCLAVVGTAAEQSIAQRCATELAPYKRPKEIRIVADMPLTHTGKVNRAEVVEALRQAL